MAERGLVAITDAGGRGAALIDLYSKSDDVSGFLAFPGNDLMKHVTDLPVETFPDIKLTDRDKIVQACLAHGAVLLDVCQDNAVAVGVANAAREVGIPTIGHTKEAGILEADKGWGRRLMVKLGLGEFLPEHRECTTVEEGVDYIHSLPEQPLFIKAVGLAEGKAALGARTREEAIQRISELKRRFPDASHRYLVEEWLRNDDGTPGEELSYFALCSGLFWQFEGAAQDHKAVNDFDEGENTGGMGCYSQPAVLTPEVDSQIKYILDRVVPGMQEEQDEEGNSRALSGDLYLGAMIVQRDGRPQVKIIEWNARLGDPEAEVILPGIGADRFDLALDMASGIDVSRWGLDYDDFTRVAITGASRGYPGDYPKGREIYGLHEVMQERDVLFYGAGVREVDGRFYTNGGRLFYVVGEGRNIVDARSLAYEAMSAIHVEGNGLHYRKDIGHRDVQRYWNNRANS